MSHTSVPWSQDKLLSVPPKKLVKVWWRVNQPPLFSSDENGIVACLAHAVAGDACAQRMAHELYELYVQSQVIG